LPTTQTKPDIETSTLASKTAVIYLRVSSKGQLTGHSAEGYSIEAQREACERYAASLNARIAAEYVEPGRSATTIRREALQRLLSELPQVRPDYVIFYDLSRVAREEADAFALLAQIRGNGSRLLSTREPVDDSPQGLLLFAIMAGVNAFRSRDDAVKIKAGLARKHADGGSMGPAKIGYRNARETVNGREVATVDVDLDRSPLVRLGFDLFATGDHTITTLTELLEDVGLRTRGTPKRPSRPVPRSSVHRMLRDDFYTGIVTLKGVKVEGRHARLVDRATFDRVQEILDGHAASGDRSSKHHHYLKGSIFCGRCEARYTYERPRSKSGRYYEYFCCVSRIRPDRDCTMPRLSVATVEEAVERFYDMVTLTRAEQAAVRRALREYVESKADVARQEGERHRRRLHELTAEQQKLVQLYYRKAVSEEVLRAEQERIERERSEAERWSTAAEREVEDVMEALEDALTLVGSGRLLYREASPHLRRLINQAIYERLLLEDADEAEAELTPLYAEILPLARRLAQEARTRPSGRRPHREKNTTPVSSGPCSNIDKMADGAERQSKSDRARRLVRALLATR
jgi:site-specific DNA recombinase